MLWVLEHPYFRNQKCPIDGLPQSPPQSTIFQNQKKCFDRKTSTSAKVDQRLLPHRYRSVAANLPDDDRPKTGVALAEGLSAACPSACGSSAMFAIYFDRPLG